MGVVAKVDLDGRLLIPRECGKEFAPGEEVEILQREGGLFLVPHPRSSLQAILARKLTMNQPTHLDLSDLDMDEIGW